MIDLLRYCFALNKLIFSRCKALNKRKTKQKTNKTKNNLGTFSNTGLPNHDESAGLEKGVIFSLNSKKTRSQPNSLHFVLLSANYQSLSQRSGSPGVTITLVFTKHTFMCFMFENIKTAFIIPPTKPFRFWTTSQDCHPVLYIPKQLFVGEDKQAQIYKQANCVPIQLDT